MTFLSFIAHFISYLIFFQCSMPYFSVSDKHHDFHTNFNFIILLAFISFYLSGRPPTFPLNRLLQFLFDHSDFYYWKKLGIYHVVPPCNKARISNFHLELKDFFKTLLLLQFFFNHSDFFTRETRHIVPPCNIAGISNLHLDFQISLKRCSSFSSYSIIMIFFFTRETKAYSVIL